MRVRTKTGEELVLTAVRGGWALPACGEDDEHVEEHIVTHVKRGYTWEKLVKPVALKEGERLALILS